MLSQSGLSLAEPEIKSISPASLYGDMTPVHEEMLGWHSVTSQKLMNKYQRVTTGVLTTSLRHSTEKKDEVSGY